MLLARVTLLVREAMVLAGRRNERDYQSHRHYPTTEVAVCDGSKSWLLLSIVDFSV